MSSENRTEQLMDKIRQDTEEESRIILEKAEKISLDRRKAQESWEHREEKSWLKKEKDFSRDLNERLEASFRMEKKKLFLQAQEHLMHRIEEEAMHRIEDSMGSSAYRDSLKSWIIEGVLSLRESPLLLKGSAGDIALMNQDLLGEIRKEIRDRISLDVRLSVADSVPELVPGVILESEDGRVSFNNQLPARFRRMKAQIRKKINQGLKEDSAS
jgi:vacuolar-type H+-ATPase subunit E/Vma4